MLSILVLVLVVSVAVAGVVSRRRRQAVIAGLATEREWAHLGEDRSLVDRYPGPPFDQGRRRRVTNVVRGRYDGRELLAFDHTYQDVDHATDRQTISPHEHSVVALSLGAAFPPLDVAPRSTVSPYTGSFLGNDLETGEPAFDRAFRVSAEDPSYALDLLVPEVRTVLLSRPDLTWRFDRDVVLAIRVGHHDADEIEPVLVALQAVVAAIPDRSWARARGDRSPRSRS